jgi:cation diffusion facilitator CzcD-associated flavoprotein CzcO
MRKPTACVIGAGSSGLPCIKALRDAGIEVDCFEMGDCVGGNWVFGNNNGISNIYRSLHINTSRTRMEYADYPMPETYPDFPGHEQIAAYFEDYVEHFDLEPHIEFETEVTHCERLTDGTWQVELNGDEHRFYDALLVANGHHWDPKFPDPPFPGEFDGETFHSHSYVDPIDPIDVYGKNVLVIGIGNSAADIASEISRPGIAKNTYLASRRGAWVVPNYFFGKPMDLIPVNNPLLHPAVPWSVREKMLNKFVKVVVGNMADYGLPEPEHEFVEAHPTISSELPVKVGRGDIECVGNVKEFRGDRVRFTSGREEPVDVIIYCTGYHVTFPFFDDEFISAPGNDLPLFKRVFRPDIPNLCFVGLLQPLGAIMPIAEAQGKWIAQYLTGKYKLPSKANMRRVMREDREEMFDRYVGSTRHTMQVDFDDYLWDIKREVRRGQKRAKRGGRMLPFLPRAKSKGMIQEATAGSFA